MAIVIAGGMIVTAAGRFAGEVRIDGSRITAVGQGLRTAGDTVLDASGCFVLPGAIDPHTHIEMPAGDGYNADTWFTGTRAAAFGGTTTVLDMITQERGNSLRSALADWQQRAGGQAVVDYGFHMGIIDPRPEVLAEVPAIIRAGVPSFKLYLAYRHLMLTDGEAFAAMQAIGRAGGMAVVHAENGEVADRLTTQALARGETAPKFHAAVRPAALEAEAVARACRLAEIAQCRVYIAHISGKEALDEVRQARNRGQQVGAETCTHYLVFTAADMDRPGLEGARLVLSPPLRTETDRESLWKALTSGEVDVVASDHCPWTWAQKGQGKDRFDQIPGGIPGVEERLPFLYTFGVESGAVSLEELVALTATQPARLFGLYPAKGHIAPGADADIVVWDPSTSRIWSAAEHHSSMDHTPYEYLPVHGATRHVLVRGSAVIRDGSFVGEAGSGRFLARPGGPSSEPAASGKQRLL